MKVLRPSSKTCKRYPRRLSLLDGDPIGEIDRVEVHVARGGRLRERLVPGGRRLDLSQLVVRVPELDGRHVRVLEAVQLQVVGPPVGVDREGGVQAGASGLDVEVLPLRLFGAARSRAADPHDPADGVARRRLADDLLAGLELNRREAKRGRVDLVEGAGSEVVGHDGVEVRLGIRAGGGLAVGVVDDLPGRTVLVGSGPHCVSRNGNAFELPRQRKGPRHFDDGRRLRRLYQRRGTNVVGGWLARSAATDRKEREGGVGDAHGVHPVMGWETKSRVRLGPSTNGIRR